MENTKIVKLSIRDFAMPSPRTGSIDLHSGFGRETQEGIEIHQRVQKLRADEDDRYESEVKVSHSFERGGFTFLIEGRMDGLFGHKIPKIEEIKSTFNIFDLTKTLHERKTSHPYYLQLLTYGYFYYQQAKILPELSFHLVSTRNRESNDLEIRLDLKAYETWLDKRLNELVIEAENAEKRSIRRKKTAADFPFPFEKPRSGQVELIERINQGMQKKERLLIQAPTGLGKTAGVLYPALKEALSRGQRVVYVTPKNSQHAVAEDAVERFQGTGAKVKSLTITAKSKMCLKPEPLCNPRFCEYAKDYYDKLTKHEVVEKLQKKKKWSARTIKKLGEEFEVCPFELQLEIAPEAEIIICDYNYVFAPQSALGRLPQKAFGQEGKPNLVIDEAHNLPSRAMAYYSPSLSSFTLNNMRTEIRNGMQGLPKRFAREAEELIDECLKVVAGIKPADIAKQKNKSMTIDPPVEPFLEQDEKLRAFLSRYLDSDVEILPKDPVLRLSFYWSEFAEMLQWISSGSHDQFFTAYQEDRYGDGGTIKITCCDASEMLKPCYDEYEQVVAFSATLKPFEYYSKLSGLEGERLKIAEYLSPFQKKNRKLMIIPQISTKYSDRERNYARIAETIKRISELKSGNYLVFFPSFDFLEKVRLCFSTPSGFQLVLQERNMANSDVEQILDDLRTKLVPTILFAVQGGVFSEGIDYPGEMVIGAFVVGPPLPNFDHERETMRKFYDDHYPRQGFDYAYTYPAMAKAVQAAGRVIRTETDRGLIVLMDARFLEGNYSQSMPSDWFESHPRELVSQGILKEVSDFWDQGDAKLFTVDAQ